MKRLILKPDGFPCTLKECRPGLFLHDENVGFKTEYGSEKTLGTDGYNEAGEYFWAGAKDHKERIAIMVQPVDPVWEEYGE